MEWVSEISKLIPKTHLTTLQQSGTSHSNTLAYRGHRIKCSHVELCVRELEYPGSFNFLPYYPY